jgi:serine acetyltransferase
LKPIPISATHSAPISSRFTIAIPRVAFIDALLYFKGFHAIQAHSGALAYKAASFAFIRAVRLNSRPTSIRPRASAAASSSIHATGFVVGETAVIEDGHRSCMA